MKRLGSLVVLAVWAASLRAQAPAVIEVTSNHAEAIVYVDSLRLGPVAGRLFVAPPGFRMLRLLAPGEASWSMPPQSQPVRLLPGDTVRVSLNFPYYHYFVSYPPGAAVHWREGHEVKALGGSPVTFDTLANLGGMFELSLAGYAPLAFAPESDIWNRYEVNLEPRTRIQAASVVSAPHQHRWWVDAAAAALVVTGGVLTVHYKFKADRLNDAYLATGDPALRPQVARLDDRAAAALFGMQAGLITIGVRFWLSK